MKIGDTVVYMYTHTSYKIGIGTVYYISDEAICIGRFGYDSITIMLNDKDWIYEVLSENTKNNFITLLKNRISEQESNIHPLTSLEKDTIMKDAFNKKKAQILATAKHMIDSKDDSEFINRLKAIGQLKKELFTIRISDISDVHQRNSEAKFEIRRLKDLLKKVKEFDYNL